MIQRIQTLYLLVAAALMGVMLYAPIAWFGVNGEEMTLRAFVLTSSTGEVATPPVWTGLMCAIACVLPLVTIFLYKRRMLQMRLCVVELVMLVGMLAMVALVYFNAFEEPEFRTLKPAAILPLPALVFVALAARAIFRDELLVKSLDRIR